MRKQQRQHMNNTPFRWPGIYLCWGQIDRRPPDPIPLQVNEANPARAHMSQPQAHMSCILRIQTVTTLLIHASEANPASGTHELHIEDSNGYNDAHTRLTLWLTQASHWGSHTPHIEAHTSFTLRLTHASHWGPRMPYIHPSSHTPRI